MGKYYYERQEGMDGYIYGFDSREKAIEFGMDDLSHLTKFEIKPFLSKKDGYNAFVGFHNCDFLDNSSVDMTEDEEVAYDNYLNEGLSDEIDIVELWVQHYMADEKENEEEED